MVRTKKFLTLLLAVLMVMQTIMIPSFAANTRGFVDFPTGEWSEEALLAALDNGIMVGTSETTIEPTKKLTRAEFAAMITRAFGATKMADITPFKDVSENDWFYESVAKVVQMGIMNGVDTGAFNPNSYMKREDVILALARLLFVDGYDTSVLDQFTDRNKIDTYAVAGVAGMVKEGYVNGYEDSTIRPQNHITRQELAQLLHNLFKMYISYPGEYTHVPEDGSVVIRSEGALLKDATINGDLVIADGVGENDFVVENVHVKGNIIIRGAEDSKVALKDVTCDGKVIVNNPNGTVHFQHYRTEKLFDDVVENTDATYLEKKDEDKKPSWGVGGGGGGGVTTPTTYVVNFFDYSGTKYTTNGTFTFAASDVDSSYITTPPAVTVPEGSAFAGWTTTLGSHKQATTNLRLENETVGAMFTRLGVTTNTINLYALLVSTIGTQPGTGSIKFNDQEGTHEIITGETGDKVDTSYIPDLADKPPYKVFMGWALNANEQDPANMHKGSSDYFKNLTIGSGEVVYHPIFKYIVKFVGEDDGELATIEKYSSYTIADADVPAAPFIDGKVFEGWVNGTETRADNWFAGKDVADIYGLYKASYRNAVVYTLTFMYPAANGNNGVNGQVIKNVNFYEYEAITGVPVDSELTYNKEAYGFSDTWSAGGSDYTKATLEGASTVKDIFGDVTNVVLVAKLTEKEKATFTFKDEAGEPLKEFTKYVPFGPLTDADVPADPTKDGYRFIGWTTDGGATTVSRNDIIGTTPVGGTDTVYTPFFKKILKVYFVDENNNPLASYEGIDTETIGAVPANVPAKDHYEFDGWTKNAETTVVTTANIEGKTFGELVGNADSVTYKTHYTPLTYTVKFVEQDGSDITDGSVSGPSINVFDVSKIPAAKTVDHFDFAGWIIGDDTTNVWTATEFAGKMFLEIVTSGTEITFKAYYTPKEYTIEFYGMGGANMLDSFTDASNKDFTGVVTAPEVSHMEFKYWIINGDASNTITDFTGKKFWDFVASGTEAGKLTAYYEQKTYTIGFTDANGDPIGSATTGPAIDTTIVVPAAPTVDGKIFKGWQIGGTGTVYTSEQLEGKSLADIMDLVGVTNISSLTFVPYYVDDSTQPTEYKVTFIKRDGSTIVVYTTEDADLTVGTATNNGFTGVPDHPVVNPDFANYGWLNVGTNEKLEASEINEKKISEVNGVTFKAQYSAKITFWVEGDSTNRTRNADSYLDASLIPETDVKPGWTFIGWKKAGDTTNTLYQNDHFTTNLVGDIYGTYVAQYSDLSKSTLAFYDENGQLIKSTEDAHDTIVTSTMIPANLSVAGKIFLGWVKEGDTEIHAAEYFYENGFALRDVAGNYYPAFDIVTYVITFKNADGSNIGGGNPVTTTVEYGNKITGIPANADILDPTKKLGGWTKKFGSSEIIANFETANVEVIFGDTTAVTVYAVEVDKDKVRYFIYHYVETVDMAVTNPTINDYYIDDTLTEIGWEKPGVENVTITTRDIANRIEQTDLGVYELAVISDDENQNIFKRYYRREIIEVRFWDVAAYDEPYKTVPLKAGATLQYVYDNYPDLATYIDDNIGYQEGYVKSADDAEYFDKYETVGDENVHRIDYYWVPGTVGTDEWGWPTFTVADDAERITVDTALEVSADYHPKMKMLSIQVEIPPSIMDLGIPLTLVVPYEDETRFIDSIRDTLADDVNGSSLSTYLGIAEGKLMKPLADRDFVTIENEGTVDEYYELNKLDRLIYFYTIMGGKASFAEWLADIVEDEVSKGLMAGSEYLKNEYNSVLAKNNDNTRAALAEFFATYESIVNALDDTAENAATKQSFKAVMAQYVDSENFITEVTTKDEYTITANNLFIIKKVHGRLSEVATIETAIKEITGKTLDAGLASKLPMDMLRNIYDVRVAKYISDLEIAMNTIEGTDNTDVAYSGIMFDIELVSEVFTPLFTYIKQTHADAVNNASGKLGSFIKEYYVNNPYPADIIGMVKDDGTEDNGYLRSDLYFEDTDGDGIYEIKSLTDIYKDVIIPLSVDTGDATLWYMDNDNINIDTLVNILSRADNKDLILRVTNHLNDLAEDYAKNGLPSDIATYYDDIMSDTVIKDALETRASDVIFIIEKQINNSILEMFYNILMSKLGAPVQRVLSAYSSSPLSKLHTEADYDTYMAQLREAWEESDTGVVGYRMTTDLMFDKAYNKIGDGSNIISMELKGLNVRIKRWYAEPTAVYEFN